MLNLDNYVFARSLHILAIVFWIGGVAFVTTVLIPALKSTVDPKNRLALFEQLESKFSFQAKITTVLTGLSGFYMVMFVEGWDRYLTLQYWWMHLMTLVWLIFTIVLFVLEPLFLHQWFHARATENGEAAINALHTMHIILLTLSIIAITGAVAGSHGYSFF